MQAGVQDPADYYRPYVLPPRTPKDRVEILRKALQDTMKDPEFLADAAKSRLDIDPVTGTELENLVARIVQTQAVHDQQTENNSVAQLMVWRESVGEIALTKESR